MLCTERGAIQSVIEDRLQVGRKLVDIQQDIYSRTSSMHHLIGEIGRQSLSLHLRSHAAVEQAESNQRLRERIQTVVNDSDQVDFAMAQYVACAYNRSIVRSESTETSISVSVADIQTDDIV